jgi:peroxiredoxin
MIVTPSTGWGVLHLFYRVDRDRADRDPQSVKHIGEAIAALQADGHQAIVFAVIGHKADLGVMAVGPDVARLQQFQHDLTAAPLVATWSYFSLTELSPYTSTEDDERARLASEDGVTGDEAEAALARWRERMAHYQEHRIHPQLPATNLVCFYPMTKRRAGDDNWYALPFETRKRLMGGHARVGRTYAGRVVQLITGSTGLDDAEWGVTLFADDPAVLKDIVAEMRFDEVSARYSDFGTFIVGLVGTPAEVLGRVGLANRVEIEGDHR